MWSIPLMAAPPSRSTESESRAIYAAPRRGAPPFGTPPNAADQAKLTPEALDEGANDYVLREVAGTSSRVASSS